MQVMASAKFDRSLEDLFTPEVRHENDMAVM